MIRNTIAAGLCLLYLGTIVFSGFLFEPYTAQGLLPGPQPNQKQTTNNHEPITKDHDPQFVHRWLGSGTVDRHWAWQNNFRRQFHVNHNAHRFLVNAQMETNPEWFPLIQGKRTPLSGGKGPNPNYAHPGFADHVAGLAETYLEENLNSKSFRLSVTDSLKFDESDLTQGIIEPLTYFRGRPDYSNLVFLFANRVAANLFDKDRETETQDTFNLKPATCPLPPSTSNQQPSTFNLQSSITSKKFLTSYAYYWAENVPSWVHLDGEQGNQNPTHAGTLNKPSTKNKKQKTKNEFERIHPNVIPFLTSDRAQWWDPEYKQKDQDLIRRWSKAGSAFIGGRDYYMGEGFIPRVYPRLAAESIQFMAKHNTRAFYAEGNPIWGFDAPTYWLAAQMLHDPRQGPEGLLTGFYQEMYGPAAKAMQAFFDRCEEIWMNQPGEARWIKYWREPSQLEVYPPEVCQELMQLLFQAYQAVGGNVKKLETGSWELEGKPQAFHWTKHGLYRARIELTLRAFHFTQVSSAYYQAWKTLVTNSLETLEDKDQFQRDLEIFKLHFSIINQTPDIGGPNPRWSAKDRLLRMRPEDRLQISLSHTHTWKATGEGGGARGMAAISTWDFEEELHVEDSDGLDGWNLRDTTLENDLSIAVEPTEHFQFLRLPEGGLDDSGCIRIQASNYTSLYKWVRIQEGQILKAGIRFKGTIAGGSRTSLYVVFRDEEFKEKVASTRLEDSPTGTFKDWLSLAVIEEAPEGATWAQVSIRVLKQQPGDYVLLDDFFISIE